MPNNIQIPYTDIRNGLGEVTPRPILTVDMIYREKLVRAAGLIDSGADVNVLPYGLGNALGLTWGEQRYPLRLSCNLASFDTRVVVFPVKVADFAPVDLAFAWTQSEQAPLIFGQTNFFQTFNVCFFRSEAYFTLTLKDGAYDVEKEG
ncbi:MAG: hypothetical protein ACYDBJ_12720 [Aggregatilineales bacterium]